ncbi:MAG: acyl-ACP--UDP-N-acetylglucosamine O-acyltransferase [Elusimicrobia bacterium]|nr:acyl-ACP--UDP-N-acetylglucosamine O-acyltransferase [Elusimicrobiota bacterium]
MSVKTHPSAIIHPSAQIDERAEIGPYAIIGEDVQIGAGTYVGPHSIIEFSLIGRNNHFTGHAFIGTPPQDYKYKNEKTRVEIGDNNIIREGVSIHRGSPSTKVTIVGSGCMFMVNSHAGHDSRIGNNVILTNSAGVGGHVEVEDGAIISGLCAIHQFVRIGRLAMIGGGAMVAQDIMPYCMAHGDRARLVGLNLVGMKRAEISRESIASIKRVYKTLFLEDLKLKEAILKLKLEKLSPEASHMVEFIEKSKRGLARPRKKAPVTFYE